MADITNLSSFLGDVADAIRSKKGSEESIPAKNFDEEILSIETGIDTSDADATEENIEKGKTAYVNGLKVTGTLEDAGESEDVMVSANNISVGNQRGYDCVSTKYTNSGKKIHKDGWYVNQHMKFEDLAPTLGVTPEKIVSGNTILGIEGTGSGGGIDTSDATATADDILAPKTAYINGKKITGSIQTTKSYLGEATYNESELAGRTGDITDKAKTKVLPDGNRLCIIGGNINVYDQTMKLLNSYTLASFGISTDASKNSVEASSLYDDTGSLLVILTYASSTKMTTSILYYKNGQLGVINHTGQTSAYKTFTVTSDYGFFAIKCYHNRQSFMLASRGYGVYRYDVNPDLSYTAVLLSSSANITRVWNADITKDDKWLALNHDVSWDGSRNVLMSLQTNATIRAENCYCDIIFVTDNYVIIRDTLYRLNNDTNSLTTVKSSFTGMLNTTSNQNADVSYGYYKGCYNNGAFIISGDSGLATIFAITDIAAGKVQKFITMPTTTGKATRLYETLDGVGVITSANTSREFTVSLGVETYLNATIHGDQLYNTYDATGNASDILSGEVVYNSTGKITGTMPNNGRLNYTPSTEEQTIPAGYTSGGSISPMDITVSKDYKTCEVIADNILGGEKQYTRLEYIQGTGTQYFTTDYTPNQNTKLEITLSDASGANGDATIFGETWGQNRFLLTLYNNSYRYFYGTEYAISDMTSKSVLSFYRRVITRDGTVLNNDSTQNDNVTYTNKLSIFRSTVGGQIASFKLYSLKIYENDTLIRDYIPVKDSSERVCLYETISNRFTYGVGDFIPGGVI